MGEPWIRVHANLIAKPVVMRAAEALKIRRSEAIGLLVTFWGSVSQFAANGEVGRFTDAQLEAWAGWERTRGRFASFVRSHHLDADGRVNEWDDYAGALEEQRRQSRDRKRRSRGQSRGRHSDSHADNGVTSSPTIRNDTQRDELTAVDEPSLTALYLTIWANGAISERWGEQPNPLTQSGAIALADALNGLGMHWPVVKESIYRQCRNSRATRPPSSVNYFRRGVEEDWQREQARVALARSGEHAPPMEGPRRPPATGGERPGLGARAFATTLEAIKDL